MQLDHPLLVLVGPLLPLEGEIDMRRVPASMPAYLSLHCLPLRPRTPCSSCSLRAMWLHLLSLLVSNTYFSSRSSSAVHALFYIRLYNPPRKNRSPKYNIIRGPIRGPAASAAATAPQAPPSPPAPAAPGSSRPWLRRGGG